MRKIQVKILFIILAFICIAIPPSYADKLLPSDGSDKAADFSTFKKKMLEAIEKRDANFIYSLITKDTKFSFGKDRPGILGFKDKYNLKNANDPFWGRMKRILLMGGTLDQDKRMIVFPYVYGKFPNKFDAFLHLAVVRENSPVREKADEKSQVIATLNYDIVAIDNGKGGGWIPPDNPKWVKIKTPDGKTGFMSEQDVYSPIGYRAGFKQVGGKWVLVFFLSGD